MASRSILSQRQYAGPDGRPNSIRIQHFLAGTTTTLIVYQDAESNTPHTFPIVASTLGIVPSIWVPYGSYRERVTLANGTLLWDADNINNDAPIVDGGGVDGTIIPTGFLLPAVLVTATTGWVRANGQSIGNASSSGTERANADTSALFSAIWNGITNAFAAVSGGRGASAAADFAANKSIALPNLQGRAVAGVVGMGGTAVTIMSPAAWYDPQLMGSVGGVSTYTITTAQMPSHNHGGVTGVEAVPITYDKPNFSSPTMSTAFPQVIPNFATSVTPTTLPNHSHPISAQGGGEAHPNVQPSIALGFYIKL